jgi:hypothetical protein
MSPLAEFSGDDLWLHSTVSDLIISGGPQAISALPITLGARRMLRTEIETLLRDAALLHAPTGGSA